MAGDRSFWGRLAFRALVFAAMLGIVLFALMRNRDSKIQNPAAPDEQSNPIALRSREELLSDINTSIRQRLDQVPPASSQSDQGRVERPDLRAKLLQKLRALQDYNTKNSIAFHYETRTGLIQLDDPVHLELVGTLNAAVWASGDGFLTLLELLQEEGDPNLVLLSGAYVRPANLQAQSLHFVPGEFFTPDILGQLVDLAGFETDPGLADVIARGIEALEQAHGLRMEDRAAIISCTDVTVERLMGMAVTEPDSFRKGCYLKGLAELTELFPKAYEPLAAVALDSTHPESIRRSAARAFGVAAPSAPFAIETAAILLQEKEPALRVMATQFFRRGALTDDDKPYFDTFMNLLTTTYLDSAVSLEVRASIAHRLMRVDGPDFAPTVLSSIEHGVFDEQISGSLLRKLETQFRHSSGLPTTRDLAVTKLQSIATSRSVTSPVRLRAFKTLIAIAEHDNRKGNEQSAQATRQWAVDTARAQGIKLNDALEDD